MKIPSSVRKLQIALGMSGLATNPMTCEIILETQKAMSKMKGDFDLKTASRIRSAIEEKYNPTQNKQK